MAHLAGEFHEGRFFVAQRPENPCILRYAGQRVDPAGLCLRLYALPGSVPNHVGRQLARLHPRFLRQPRSDVGEAEDLGRRHRLPSLGPCLRFGGVLLPQDRRHVVQENAQHVGRPPLQLGEPRCHEQPGRRVRDQRRHHEAQGPAVDRVAAGFALQEQDSDSSRGEPRRRYRDRYVQVHGGQEPLRVLHLQVCRHDRERCPHVVQGRFR